MYEFKHWQIGAEHSLNTKKSIYWKYKYGDIEVTWTAKPRNIRSVKYKNVPTGRHFTIEQGYPYRYQERVHSSFSDIPALIISPQDGEKDKCKDKHNTCKQNEQKMIKQASNDLPCEGVWIVIRTFRRIPKVFLGKVNMIGVSVAVYVRSNPDRSATTASASAARRFIAANYSHQKFSREGFDARRHWFIIFFVIKVNNQDSKGNRYCRDSQHYSQIKS